MKCVVCEEAITNPICPACVQEGVEQWLFEEHREELVPEVNELTRAVFLNNGDVECIRCKSLMGICTYCYTKEVFELIKRQPRLVAHYLTYFNYDLEHLGWEKEARAYTE